MRLGGRSLVSIGFGLLIGVAQTACATKAVPASMEERLQRWLGASTLALCSLRAAPRPAQRCRPTRSITIHISI